MRQNRAAFSKLATMQEGKESRLLVKVTGGLDHGGERVLKPDSTGYRILANFVQRATTPHSANLSKDTTAADKNAPPFFDGIAMLDDRKLLRRVTLSLAGRLPKDAELETAQTGGLKA